MYELNLKTYFRKRNIQQVNEASNVHRTVLAFVMEEYKRHFI